MTKNDSTEDETLSVIFQNRKYALPKDFFRQYAIKGRKGITSIKLESADFNKLAAQSLISAATPFGTLPNKIIADEEGITVTGTFSPEYSINQEKKPILLTYEDAASRIAVSADFYLRENKDYLNRLKEESSFWERINRFFTIIGFIIIAIGIAIAFFYNYIGGAVTILFGYFEPFLIKYLFPQHKLASRRLDHYMESILDAQKFYSAIEIANTVKDPAEHNKLITTIVQGVIASLIKGYK